MRTTFRLDDHLLREAKRVAAESSRTLTAVVGRLRNHPHCVIVHPGQRHWGIFVDLCKQVKAESTRQCGS